MTWAPTPPLLVSPMAAPGTTSPVMPSRCATLPLCLAAPFSGPRPSPPCPTSRSSQTLASGLRAHLTPAHADLRAAMGLLPGSGAVDPLGQRTVAGCQAGAEAGRTRAHARHT